MTVDFRISTEPDVNYVLSNHYFFLFIPPQTRVLDHFRGLMAGLRASLNRRAVIYIAAAEELCRKLPIVCPEDVN